MESITRFFNPPSDESFFLFGPRGTGKSTWLRSHFPKALWVDLLEPKTFREISARPERLRDWMTGLKAEASKVIVIDEVQRLPEILNLVHSLIEEKNGWIFALTGSSARKLKRTGIDLLAGRAILQTFHPFMASELGPAFNLNVAIAHGLLPLVVASKQPARKLSSYISLYINEEVKMEGLVRNIGSFSRFLEAISFSHGSVLNASNIARECQVGQKTVEGYISILEDLLLSFKLPIFSKRAGRELSSHPKFYFFDAGVFRAIRPRGPLDKPSEIEGGAVEGLVAQHLRAWASHQESRNDICFWRTRSGNEVDFIVYGTQEFSAIEVKNTTVVRSDDLRGLHAFREDYPESKQLFLYRGSERMRYHDILCIPLSDFLMNLRPGKSIMDAAS
jgi:predicted AAA+ superfamily ATPase